MMPTPKPMPKPQPRRKAGPALALALASALGIGLGAPRAAEAQEMPASHEIPPDVAKKITHALDFLASKQHPDGYWVEHIGHKVNEDYEAHLGRHVGVTALACIAFMSNGSVPGRGRYGDNVQRGLDFVLSQVGPEDGFIATDGSRMYSHGFATLFLAEAYGMSGAAEIRPKLQLAADCLVNSQNEQGGWRYKPHAPDSDISITVTAVQALRAARNVGIFVPSRTIDKATEYVKRSQISGMTAFGNGDDSGGFWYQIEDSRTFPMSRTSFALTAAGVTALYSAGAYDSATEIRQGLAYLLRPGKRPRAWTMSRTFDYFYGHYYAIQAFYQAGGRLWDAWYPSVRDEILAGANADGYWEDLVGPCYATAMATIILQIPYRYLPIFER